MNMPSRQLYGEVKKHKEYLEENHINHKILSLKRGDGGSVIHYMGNTIHR